jgi:hypothetical protein
MTETGWAVVLTYMDDGHVDDSDAAKIDYDDLLKDMKEGTEGENAARKKDGYPPVHLLGWAEKPHYDATAKKLYWAKEFHIEGSQQNSLNYDVRVLGREGVLSMNAIAGMNQLPQIHSDMNSLIEIAEFNESYRYAQFNKKTDRTAEYGLAGLIAVGVGAKLGLFAKLMGDHPRGQESHSRGPGRDRRIPGAAVWQEEGRFGLSHRFKVVIEPGGHELLVAAGENILARGIGGRVALATQLPRRTLRVLQGEADHRRDRVSRRFTAARHRGFPKPRAAKWLLCQARPRSDLRIASRSAPGAASPVRAACSVERATPLSTGGQRVTLKFLGTPVLGLRPGQFIDVEMADGTRERVPVVAVSEQGADVEVLELAPQALVRARGPFDAPR